MARKFAVTRTVKTQIVSTLIFDKETVEPSNTTVTVTPPINDRDKLEKVVANMLNKGNIKFIEIVDIVEDEALYGITMEDFMAYAVRLDPETRKAISE